MNTPTKSDTLLAAAKLALHKIRQSTMGFCQPIPVLVRIRDIASNALEYCSAAVAASEDTVEREKPPVGPRPNWLVSEHRVDEIIEAAERFRRCGQVIGSELLSEAADLARWLEECGKAKARNLRELNKAASARSKRTLLNALNRLIWKLPSPSTGDPNDDRFACAEDVAQYWINEIADGPEGVTGIKWNPISNEFECNE